MQIKKEAIGRCAWPTSDPPTNPSAAQPELMTITDDPLDEFLRPPPDETFEEREQRLAREEEANRISQAIDASIKAEKQARKKRRIVRLLLLGQSESEFQRLYTPTAFREERILWRAVIQLNIVRSIRIILETLASPLPPPKSPKTSPYSSPRSRTRSISRPPPLPSHIPPLPDSIRNGHNGNGHHHGNSSRHPSDERVDSGNEFSDEESDNNEFNFSRSNPSSTTLIPSPLEALKARLEPLRHIEALLIAKLVPPNEDEATHLGSTVSSASHPLANGQYPSPTHSNSNSNAQSYQFRTQEIFVRPGAGWKGALSKARVIGNTRGEDSNLGRPTSAGTTGLETQDEPQQVLNQCRKDIMMLWNDDVVREILVRKKVRLEELPGFFLNDLERVTSLKYMPTDDDVLRARLKTVGVSEYKFEMEVSAGRDSGTEWRIVDVGGSRSQEDSVLLWKAVCSNKLLANVDLVLFLNKCDILDSKLQAGIKYVKSYGDRENDLENVSKYLRGKFSAIHREYSPNPRKFYAFLTSVTDTATTAGIIASVDPESLLTATMTIRDICPQLRDRAFCKDERCKYAHPMLSCDTCSFLCLSDEEMTEHMGSEAHSKKKSEKTPTHDNAEALEVPGSTLCVACNLQIKNIYWNVHLRNPEHLKKDVFSGFKVALEEAEQDKHGVVIRGDFDFGVVAAHSRGVVALGSIVTGNTASSRVTLLEARLASAMTAKKGKPGFELVVHGGRRLITSTPINFSVTFAQSYIGRYQDRAEFHFEDTQRRTRFVIVRHLLGVVGDRDDHEKLRPVAPYIPRPQTTRQPVLEIVEGVRPPSTKAIPYVAPLPHATIPNTLLAALSTGSLDSMLMQMKKTFIPKEFNASTYSHHFKHLLWIEECQMARDLQFEWISPMHWIIYKVLPVLKCKALLKEDRVFWSGIESLSRLKARDMATGLKVEFMRSWSNDQLFNVRFQLNRIPVRRQHQALENDFAEERVLFPGRMHLPKGPYPKQSDVHLQIINPQVRTNPPQLQAVISILNQPSGSLPFVIFGPPGTGKTVTMVESIRQVLLADSASRVLVCAPSNSAADNIALRLRDLGPDQLFRFYAPTRYKESVPYELLQYTFARSDGHFTTLPIAKLKRCRIVVTTCVSASFASGIGLPRGHFTHIFIDEAGQATEPEVFIAIKTMAGPRTQIVLAGDPKQLGPIIRSTIARKLGLETSYLERLLHRDAYDLGQGYGLSSHPSILKFPNERFYDNELVPCGGNAKVNKYINSPCLPNPKFPVVFHGVCGKDDRETSSPSFFNVEEVLQVKAYIKSLRSDRHFRTTDDDIGVISPYNAQCRKIRTALRGVADSVKVGSVEEFQGQERSVIIISTVRSSTEFIEFDLRHTLGFVANPRRFNVSITRAQALLIIIGDPTVLSIDPLWRSFLNYVHQNGGWTGSPITWNPAVAVDESGGYDTQIREAAQIDMNEFTRQMETLTLAGVEAYVDDEGNIDRPWRDVDWPRLVIATDVAGYSTVTPEPAAPVPPMWFGTSRVNDPQTLNAPQVPLEVKDYPAPPNGLELEQVHVYVRHGERAPVGVRLTNKPASIPEHWLLCNTARQPVVANGTEDNLLHARQMVERVDGSVRAGEWSTNMPRTIASLQQVVHGLYPQSNCGDNVLPEILVRQTSSAAATSYNPTLETLDAQLSKYIDGRPVRVDGKPRASGIMDTIRAAIAHDINVPPEFKDKHIVGTLDSTHDTAIAALCSTLDVFDEKWPAFTASVTFELFKKDASPSSEPGDVSFAQSILSNLKPRPPPEFYIRMRYQNRNMILPACAEEGDHLSGSPEFCTLKAFRERVKELTPDDWEAECVPAGRFGL
ncbi:hypothetical protein H0H93_001427 [Arthromyces matolae]|nr:hypothetical protein H0H93_001427 [Arthromyces matolae]